MSVIDSTSFDGTANNALYLGGLAANGFVNTSSITAYAPLANPTFTGNVALTTLSANGSVGTNGQILTSNGSTSYWATPVTGLSNVDYWYLAANWDNSAWGGNGFGHYLDRIYSNDWTRVTSGGYTPVGSGLTHSTGIFTFPSTGTWEVVASIYCTSQYNSSARVDYSTDSGTNWTAQASAYGVGQSASACIINTFFTITNASTFRIRFLGAGLVYGNADRRTFLTFKKVA